MPTFDDYRPTDSEREAMEEGATRLMLSDADEVRWIFMEASHLKAATSPFQRIYLQEQGTGGNLRITRKS